MERLSRIYGSCGKLTRGGLFFYQLEQHMVAPHLGILARHLGKVETVENVTHLMQRNVCTYMDLIYTCDRLFKTRKTSGGLVRHFCLTFGTGTRPRSPNVRAYTAHTSVVLT